MYIQSFDGQREDENVVAAWRQHPWILSKTGLIVLAIVVVGSLPEAIWSPSWGIFFLFVFILGAIAYGSIGFFLWLNTIYILTNERIFAIFQRGVLFRVNNEVPLNNIQNILHTKKGVFQMMLDYGDVEIETSGAKTAMSIKNVARPYRVQQRILSKELKDSARK